MGEGLALARSKIARFFFEVGRSVVFAAGRGHGLQLFPPCPFCLEASDVQVQSQLCLESC